MGATHALHSPNFVMDESVLAVGARIHAAVARQGYRRTQDDLDSYTIDVKRSRKLDCRLHVLELGFWTLDSGLWTLDSGL